LENVIKVMLMFGGAAAVFFLISKIFGASGQSNTKNEMVTVIVVLVAMAVAFVIFFGLPSGSSAPWERLQRR
jgi:Zn-dependent protease with chaperone function